MSLFSKLFGNDKEAEKTAKDLLGGIFGGNNAKPSEKPAESRPSSSYDSTPAVNEPEPDGPSGFSWGPKMPAEENQYNYNGTFTQYFESIFASAFSQYRYDKEKFDKRYVYTFYNGGNKALVIELLSQSNAVYKYRNDCAKAGIPYTRFYYDHEGWWNTKEYVIKRINDAMFG